jgi:hypothetical protein
MGFRINFGVQALFPLPLSFLKCIQTLFKFCYLMQCNGQTEEHVELKNCNTKRLKHKPAEAGVQNTEVAKMDRQALPTAVAEWWVVESSGAMGGVTTANSVEVHKPMEILTTGNGTPKMGVRVMAELVRRQWDVQRTWYENRTVSLN